MELLFCTFALSKREVEEKFVQKFGPAPLGITYRIEECVVENMTEYFGYALFENEEDYIFYCNH